MNYQTINESSVFKMGHGFKNSIISLIETSLLNTLTTFSHNVFSPPFQSLASPRMHGKPAFPSTTLRLIRKQKN